jgi:hypothetical protein
LAEPVDDGGDVEVFVGVDTAQHPLVRLFCHGDGAFPSSLLVRVGTHGRDGGQDSDGAW